MIFAQGAGAEMKRGAGEAPVPPLIETVDLNEEEPQLLFKRAGWRGAAALLEGMRGGWFDGRFSLLAGDPFGVFQSKGARSRFIARPGAGEEIWEQTGDVLADLQAWLDRFHPATTEFLSSDIPFAAGGAVGFFSYDLIGQWERIPPADDCNASLPDIFLLFINHFALIDHERRRIHLVYNPQPEVRLGKREETARRRGREKLRLLRKALFDPSSTERSDLPAPPPSVEADLSSDDYVRRVLRAKEYIAAGDIFQANLSHRFRIASGMPSPFSIYRRLRRINPSPFAAYLDLGEIEVASGSPERLVRVADHGGRRIVETRPIAGTRPRGTEAAEDERLMNALYRSEKERAEHLMLVDLERNDLGKICRYGSVVVDPLMAIEKYSHVAHLVSNVSGTLRPETTSTGVIKALFPGGTITGVPKIRCMEIIAEIEKRSRGLYTGSIGYIDFTGGIDLNIAIRSWVRQGKEMTFQVGAGIVADSDPEMEYQETLQKAAALLKALEP